MAASLPGFLLLKSQVEEGEDPLLLSHPDSPPDLTRAAKLKGLFLALAALTRTLANTEIRIASLSSQRPPEQCRGPPGEVAGCCVKAAYAHVGPVVVVLLLPGRLADATAQGLAQSFQCNLLFELGSPPGWLEKDQKSLNSDSTRRIKKLCRSWICCTNKDNINEEFHKGHRLQPLTHSLSSAAPVFLPSADLSCKLVEAANLAETLEGTLHERCLTQTGWLDYKEACLLHRGLVVYSDMSFENTAMVWALCEREGLLCQEKGQGQHLLLQDVYVQVDTELPLDICERKEAKSLWKLETREKRALLVVALGSTLLCLLVQPESNNMAAEQLAESSVVDAAISQLLALDQAGTLAQLDTEVNNVYRNCADDSTASTEARGADRLCYNPHTGAVACLGPDQDGFQECAAVLRDRLLLMQAGHVSNGQPPNGIQQNGTSTGRLAADLSVRFESADPTAHPRKTKKQPAILGNAYWVMGRTDHRGRESFVSQRGLSTGQPVGELFEHV